MEFERDYKYKSERLVAPGDGTACVHQATTSTVPRPQQPIAPATTSRPASPAAAAEYRLRATQATLQDEVRRHSSV